MSNTPPRPPQALTIDQAWSPDFLDLPVTIPSVAPRPTSLLNPRSTGNAATESRSPRQTRTLPKRKVLREEIRDRLMEEIIGGHLVPGDRLVETRIAQVYGVSQAPVREALRDLELMGFVVSAPFRGSVVREVSTRDLLQIYPIRAALEGLAAREAATRLDSAGFKKLDRLIASMRESARRGDARSIVTDDLAFHLTIVEASDNSLLKEFWQRMRLGTTTSVGMLWPNHSLDEIAERHVPVVQALKARDPDAAETTMRRHIADAGGWLLESLKESAKEASAAHALRPRQAKRSRR